MIVDPSAIVAILRAEDDAAKFSSALAGSSSISLSAAGYLEAAMVIDGAGHPITSRQLDKLVSGTGITVVPFDERQARVARQAFNDYGKGSGHPARLNFGDCFSYALASVTGQPLLYKGDDFGHTDVTSAI